MIRTPLLFVLLISLATCRSSSDGIKEPTEESRSSMAPANAFTASLFLTYTSSYCGGAEPPEEMLRQLATPRPLEGQEVFIRSGVVNDPAQPIVTKGITDASGMVQFALAPGDYAMVFSDKKNNDLYNDILKKYTDKTSSTEPVDIECLDRWLRSPELVIHVEADRMQTYSYNLHKPCSWNSLPCVPYTGPYPP